MKERETLEQATARYKVAARAMQSGVKYYGELIGTRDQEPKHLRVGINSAQVSLSAITSLLVAKGIVTQEEYATAVADAMEDEVVRYQKDLSAALGRAVVVS